MSLLPAVGMVIQHAGAEGVCKERILWLDRAADLAVLIALDDESALPRPISAKDLDKRWRNSELTQAPDDFAHLAALTVKHVKRRDQNYAAIESIVNDEPRCYDKRIRAGMLTRQAQLSKRGRNTLIRDLRRYWQSGKQKNGLATNYSRSGGKGERRILEHGKKPGRSTIFEKNGITDRGLPITPELAKVIDAYYKKHVLKRNPLTETGAYELMIAEKASVTQTASTGQKYTEPLPENRRPSLRQFRYYGSREYGLALRKKAQDGAEAYEQTMRPVLGNSSLVMGPGSAFQIDATETDVELVNSILRERPIGRSNHYFLTDAFSGLIGGMYVGLEAPSVLMVRQTLANCASDKVAFCAKYDIPIEESEWPCHHLPESIIADRGEVIAKAVDAIVDELNLRITNLPAYRPDWKAFVEGSFAHANRLLHGLPGAIRRDSEGPRGPDAKLEAVLDIFADTQLLIHFVITHNKTHVLKNHPFDLFEIQENVRPRPLDLWRWGMLHRSGALRILPDDAIRRLLLERGEATVSGYGLTFGDADYDCSIARDQEWFQRARSKGKWKVQICFDRRNTEYVYLLQDRGPLIACPLLRRDRQMIGLSLEDIQDYQQFLKLRNAQLREEELAGKVNLQARKEEIVEDQLKRKRDRKKTAPPVSKSQAHQGVREHRNEERARQNAQIHREQTTDSAANAPQAPTAAMPVSLAERRTSKQLQALRERRQEKG